MLSPAPKLRCVHRHPSARSTAVALVAGLGLIGLAGCPAEPEPLDPTPRPAPVAPPSPWRLIDGAPRLALPNATEADAELQEAIDHARSTARAAAARWNDGDAEERGRWLVAWAARTEAGGVEHLWVRPLSWSPFRVEGELASAPQQLLEREFEAGDVVAFPIEELVDWLRAPNPGATPAEVVEGGFTIAVLERRFGPVP